MQLDNLLIQLKRMVSKIRRFDWYSKGIVLTMFFLYVALLAEFFLLVIISIIH